MAGTFFCDEDPSRQPTMRRFDSSLAIALKIVDRSPPVLFQKSGCALPLLSFRTFDSEAQDLSSSICFFSAELVASRSTATVMTMMPAVLALAHSASKCWFIADV